MRRYSGGFLSGRKAEVVGTHAVAFWRSPRWGRIPGAACYLSMGLFGSWSTSWMSGQDCGGVISLFSPVAIFSSGGGARHYLHFGEKIGVSSGRSRCPKAFLVCVFGKWGGRVEGPIYFFPNRPFSRRKKAAGGRWSVVSGQWVVGGRRAVSGKQRTSGAF